MQQVISLTNMKQISMSVPNGEGRLIELAPGETKLVQGEFEYFRRMPGQGVNGLVVKIAKGEKVRLVEGVGMDVVRATVKNHRRIPMDLATGIGHASIHIGPGETSQPTNLRLSLVKQMSGISVKVIEENKAPEPPAKPGAPATPPAPEAVKVEAPGELRNGANVAAIAEAAKADEAEIVQKRKNLALPATKAEWEVRKEQLTWPDVRGIAKELGIKSKSSSKEELLGEVEKLLYPS